VRAVVQRARDASVVVAGDVVGAFEGPGLVVLVGATHDDTHDRARRLAAKVHELRIFDPAHAPQPLADARRELSAAELGLPLLVVSQFTLYGDTRKGRRPSFVDAARPAQAEPLCEAFVGALRALGAQVETGRFRTHMQVELVNDGPVTLSLEV